MNRRQFLIGTAAVGAAAAIPSPLAIEPPAEVRGAMFTASISGTRLTVTGVAGHLQVGHRVFGRGLPHEGLVIIAANVPRDKRDIWK